MGVSGYNKPDSTVFHVQQRCHGAYFPPAADMDSVVAENRGLKPCGTCCDGEWPHDTEDDGGS